MRTCASAVNKDSARIMLRRATRFPRVLQAFPGSLGVVGETKRKIWSGMNLGEEAQGLGCLQGITGLRLDCATRGFASLGSEQEVERNEEVRDCGNTFGCRGYVEFMADWCAGGPKGRGGYVPGSGCCQNGVGNSWDCGAGDE